MNFVKEVTGERRMKRRLRITQVVHDFHPVVGGIETYAYNLAKGLADAGHYVSVYTAQVPGAPARDEWQGIHIHRFRVIARPFNYPLLPGLIPALLQHPCDILHAHINSPMTVDMVAFASRLSSTPLVVTYHADALVSDLTTRIPVCRSWLNQVYRRTREIAANVAQQLIVTSPLYLEQSSFLQHYREKCSIIPASVNPDYLQPPQDANLAKAQLGFKPNQFLLLFVGRLVLYKGLQTLLQAFHSIHTHIPQAQLLIVGTGPEESHLQDLSQQLGLSDSIHFLGVLSQSHLRNTYSACDVFILPSRSRSEAFGIVQLEAMAHAKPVVATNVGGVPYVVKDQETGLIVPPNDSASLAQAIERLLKDSKLRHRLGHAGRTRVMTHFTRGPITQQLEQLYFRLLS